jgi:3-deoxy-D-manno-octulosonate 8-phosphate phosphatase (KDO 8-P phosphatase)
MENSVERRASRIKLLLMDCDGVLTNGELLLMGNGEEQKSFNVRDGLGLELWRQAGLKSGIISGRRAAAVERRAQELRIDYLRQGSQDKLSDFQSLLKLSGINDNEVAFIGDDLNDIPLLRQAELAIAVGDAAQEVKQVAHYVTKVSGGEGAVREAIEFILRAQGRWNELIDKYVRG